MLLLSGSERIAHSSVKFLGIGLLLLSGSILTASAGPRVDYMPIGQPNQCLADAVGFQTMLHVQYPGSWSRILKVNWNVRVAGQYTAHAYCIYEIDNKLYAYDSGSGQRRLDLPTSAKRHPEVLGQYLGRRYFASAKYLPAFDPLSLGLSGRSAAPSAQPLAELAWSN